MPHFKIINNYSDINNNHGWKDSLNFKSKNRMVNDKGQVVAADYDGHCYQLIAKQERKFSNGSD